MSKGQRERERCILHFVRALDAEDQYRLIHLLAAHEGRLPTLWTFWGGNHDDGRRTKTV
jgi:hypothetical protein